MFAPNESCSGHPHGVGRPIRAGDGGRIRPVRPFHGPGGSGGGGHADLARRGGDPDGADRGFLPADRAVHRGLHRDRPRPPGLLHVHGRRAALLRGRAGREDDAPRAGPGADRSGAGGAGGGEHRGGARDDAGDRADRRAGNPGVQSARVPGGAADPGGAAHVPARGGVRGRHGDPGRVDHGDQPARHVDAGIRQGAVALLRAIRRHLFTDQDDVVRRDRPALQYRRIRKPRRREHRSSA